MKLSPHLNPKIFDGDIEKSANRNGYGEGLKLAGERFPQVVALSADLVESTKTNLFAEAFPERFIECGVAEQNMASVASGLSAMGKVPFIASYAMFSPGRNWEQVRTTIAYNNANVKIIGAHSGISVGPDGATHQAIEDMAIMRVMPNMTVIAPVDKHEARKATLFAAERFGPVYMRLARNDTPVVTKEDSPFTFGKAEIFMEKSLDTKKSVAILSTGTMAYHALLAGKELNESGIGASVVHFGTVKPLDTKMLERLSKEHDLILTVEEHQAAGGFGSAVAEYLSETRPTKIIRIGVRDEFGQSGTPEELLSHYGLDSKAIIKAATEVLSVET